MSSASLISPASSPTLRPPGPRHNDVQDPPKSRTAAAPSSCTSGPPERTRRNKRPFSVNGPSGAFCYSNRRRPEIPERRFKRTAGSGSHQPHVASPETCCRQPVWRVREDSQSEPANPEPRLSLQGDRVSRRQLSGQFLHGSCDDGRQVPSLPLNCPSSRPASSTNRSPPIRHQGPKHLAGAAMAKIVSGNSQLQWPLLEMAGQGRSVSGPSSPDTCLQDLTPPPCWPP